MAHPVLSDPSPQGRHALSPGSHGLSWCRSLRLQAEHSSLTRVIKALIPSLQYCGHLMRRTDSLEKTLMLGESEGRRRRGVTEAEMVGWHH